MITSAATVRRVDTRSHSAVSAPTRKAPDADVTASPSVSMRMPAGDARVSGVELSLAAIVESSRVSESTCTLPVPGVREISAVELMSEPSTTRSTMAARSTTLRVSADKAPPITAPVSRVIVRSATSASASICWYTSWIYCVSFAPVMGKPQLDVFIAPIAAASSPNSNSRSCSASCIRRRRRRPSWLIDSCSSPPYVGKE